MTRFDVIKQEISKMDNPIDLMAIMCVITYRFRKDAIARGEIIND